MRIFTYLLYLIVTSLLLCEIGLRFVVTRSDDTYWKIPPFPFFDRMDGPGVYYAHPYSAYQMKPNKTSAVIYLHAEGPRMDVIDEYGFREPRKIARKPQGTFRIFCIGESTTYGARNTYEHTYPFLLEQKLKALLPGRTIEVVNAGLVSATTAESLPRLIHPILDLEPDMVILYHGFNDLVPRIANNFRTDYAHFRATPLSPWYGAFPILDHSYLARAVRRLSIGNQVLHDFTFRKENIPKDLPSKLENFKKNTPAVFQKNMEVMIHLLQSYSIEVVVPTFAFVPGKEDTWIDDFPGELWQQGIEENNQVIRELQTKYHLSAIDLNLSMKEYPELMSGKIHFNDEGNDKVAGILAQAILSQIR